MRFRALDFWLSLAMLGWFTDRNFGILLFLMASQLAENGETRPGHATAVPSHDQQTRLSYHSEILEIGTPRNSSARLAGGRILPQLDGVQKRFCRSNEAGLWVERPY
jgi:hypothetical protein